MAITESVGHYLRAMHELGHEAMPVTTTRLARRMQVSAASASAMLKKLAAMRPRLVEHERHRGARLTRAGEKIALEMIRHHRLIELYLQQALGYPWDEVHQEADRLEHVISEDFEDRIANLLGDPKYDPHGDPIPAKDGRMPDSDFRRLSDLDPGQSGRIRRVPNDDPEMLRYFHKIGVVPDAVVRVTERGPFDGPVHILAAGCVRVLALSLSAQILVEALTV